MLIMTKSGEELLLSRQNQRSLIIYQILVVVLLTLLIGLIAILLIDKNRNGVHIVSKSNSPNNVEGIDVSHWDGSIDWLKVAKSGKNFTFVKATDGLSVDSTFSTNFYGASNAGLYVGPYHFAIPSHSSGSVQANYFLKNGGKTIIGNKTLIGALDMENRQGMDNCYGLSQQKLIEWINDFISTYYISTNNNPIIYTRTEWWNTCFGNMTWSPTQPLLWISRYRSGSDPGALPNGFSTWTFWQYSETGRVNGIKGSVDLNRQNENLNWNFLVHQINKPIQIIDRNNVKISFT